MSKINKRGHQNDVNCHEHTVMLLRHDTVLRQIIAALKTFISNIKETVPISAKAFIKFVKKEQKCLAKGVHQLAFSIMHQTGFLQQILIAITVSQSTLPSLNLDLTLQFSQTI